MSAFQWSHRAYFQRYRLNVEQYGEILVADAFRGKKLGDGQPCYDVECGAQEVRQSLMGVADLNLVNECVPNGVDDTVLIEVKAKVTRGASVVHCHNNKIEGARSFKGATHFAVILFDEQGVAAPAWLFPSAVARALRREQTKSRHILVSSLKNPVAAGIAEHRIIDITKIINSVAERPLCLDEANGAGAGDSAEGETGSR